MAPLLLKIVVALLLLVRSHAVPAQSAEGSPLLLGAAYTLDLLTNVSGGLRRDPALLGKLDVDAELDGGTVGIDGFKVYVQLQYVHGRPFSGEVVGDAQVVSNIEAPSALRPFEAWMEFPIASPAAHLKLGLIDLNSEFDVQSIGAHFLNSSHGIGPDFSQSGLNGPSIFPTTAGAAVFRVRSGGWTGRLGLFDAIAGHPDKPQRWRAGLPGDRGLLAVGEIERSLGENAAVKFGAWGYSTRFDALAEFEAAGSPKRLRGNKGAYATLEGRILERETRELSAWLRFGLANSRINLIVSALGGGMTWGNDDQRLGLAFSRAQLGEEGMNVLAADGEKPAGSEFNLELSYAIRLSEYLTLQPDLQYVSNPGWRRDIGDAVVIGFRTILELGSN